MLTRKDGAVVGVYHKDVGFPANAAWPAGQFPVRYSRHAQEEARADRFGDVSGLLPCRLDVGRCRVIEAQVDASGRVWLMVLRTPLDAGRDLVVVVDADRVPWFARTVYVNRRGDEHRTLDRGRYDTPAAKSYVVA